MSDKGFKIAITLFACTGLAALGFMFASDLTNLSWAAPVAGVLGALFIVGFVSILLAAVWSA